FDENLEIGPRSFLPDELVEPGGPERNIEFAIASRACGGEIGHERSSMPSMRRAATLSKVTVAEHPASKAMAAMIASAKSAFFCQASSTALTISRSSSSITFELEA